MDFTNAALLIAAVFSVTRLVDLMFPQVEGPWLQGVSLIIAMGVTFLVAESDWAAEQLVGGKPMDQLSIASLVLVGFMLAGGANIVDRAVTAVMNIGENQSPKEQPAAVPAPPAQ